MIVVCFLPPPQAAAVQRAIRPPDGLEILTTWDSLLSALRRPTCDIAVIDPCMGGDHLAAPRLEGLGRMVRDPFAAQVLGYLSVTAAALRSAHTLARLGAAALLIRGLDDSADAISAAFARAVTARASQLLLRALTQRLEALPGTLSSAVRLAFEHPDRVRSVSDLASAADTTRRSLDRWLMRVGLPSARTLLSSARANAAFHLLADGGVRARDAALRVGYSSARSLTRDLVALTGQPASAIPRRLSRAAFVAALSKRLAPGGEAGAFACGSY